jgi:hypothetical protein
MISENRRVRVTAQVGLTEAPIPTPEAAFEIAAPVLRIEDPNWHGANAPHGVRIEAGRVGGIRISDL